jgi:predicted histone-like DNA-binding protein
MAKIIYEVYQNQNEHNAAYGKWYGRVKYLESMNTRKLSNHIAEHGSIYTPDVVYGVMEKFRSCLLEMLLNSKKVKIEGLGTFYTTLECVKGGAVSKDKFNILKDVKGLHIRFLPEQEQEQNISSRQFLKQAEFINVDSLLPKEEDGTTGNGSTNSGNGSSQSGNGGSQSGNEGGSQSGSENQGDQNQATSFALTITKSGSGTSTVKNDSEETINSGDSLESGANVYIAVTPAEGQIPTATLNGESVSLSENDGEYVGTFQMPAQASSLVINSGSVSGGSADQN